MSKAVMVARVLLGVMFVVFGLNGFLHFIPVPPPQGAAGVLMGGFAASGYMFPLIFGTQFVGGVLLLAGLVPLGLVVLAPVIVNILAFHAALDPAGLGSGVVTTLVAGFLAWAYRASFMPLFQRGPARAA